MNFKQDNGRFIDLKISFAEGHKPDHGKLKDAFSASWHSDIDLIKKNGVIVHRSASPIEIDALHLPAHSEVAIVWSDEPTYFYFVEHDYGRECLAEIKVTDPLLPLLS